MATLYETDGGMDGNLPLDIALEMMDEPEDDILITGTIEARSQAINWVAQDLYPFKDRDIIRGGVVVCEDGELEEAHV